MTLQYMGQPQEPIAKRVGTLTSVILLQSTHKITTYRFYSMQSSKINSNNLRQCRIENQLDQIRELSWAQIIECAPKGIQRDDVWILWIPGRKGTIWQGGQYPVQITFPQQYPKLGPLIKFQSDFKHVHVYKGGAICLPLIEAEYWRSKTNMSDILQRIINLIHQQINPYSPANMQVFQLYKANRQQYEKIIKGQAIKYSKKAAKYFQQACLHINSLVEE